MTALRNDGSVLAEPGPGSGPLGILAGAGAYPIEIADAVTRQGRAVHIVALDGFADAETARYPHERVGLGQVGRILASFRRAGCRDLVIAGALRRPDLTRLKPDWGLIRFLPTILSLTRGGDDSVLRRVVQFFERQGFVVRGAADIAPDLLAGPGALGTIQPTPQHLAAIALASRAIAALGEFDIGQAAIATPDHVLALETVRGTDALLTALATGPRHDNAVLVKRAKPGQELRVDLPAIGGQTIDGARTAGLAGVAVGAGSAIVLERADMIARANAAGLFVYGIPNHDVPATPPAPDVAAPRPLKVLARRAPTPSERRDIAIGRRLMPILGRENLGRAAVISGEHVRAVSATSDIPATVRMIGRDNQWGRSLFKSRMGTLMIDLSDRPDGPPADAGTLFALDIFAAARDCGLAGVVYVGAGLPAHRRDEIIGWANDARIVLQVEESGDV